MKFYIIDDDPSITIILQQIIEEDFTHTVVKVSTCPKEALKDLMILDIDIVLIDLLMPEVDGVSLVEQVHRHRPNLKFIMISQVKDETLRQKAYQAGIEFFITKPINIVEVRSVVGKVKENIEMEHKLKHIQELLGSNFTNQNHKQAQEKKIQHIQMALSYLGISAETGYTDIMDICRVMLEYQISFDQIDFQDHLSMDPHQQKVALQRVRRAVKKAMINLAHLCLDAYEDETPRQYANTLFGYQNIHLEMLVIEGKGHQAGKISLRQFFDGLVTLTHSN